MAVWHVGSAHWRYLETEWRILTRLASSVETKHQQAHFLAAKDLGHHL
jgi:hypothetical protein